MTAAKLARRAETCDYTDRAPISDLPRRCIKPAQHHGLHRLVTVWVAR